MWYGRSQEGVPQLQSDLRWMLYGLYQEIFAKVFEVKIVLENGYSCNAPACLLTAFSDIFRKLISAQATQETLSSENELENVLIAANDLQVTSLVSLICEEMTERILENTSPPISLLYSAIACLPPQSQYRNMVVDGAAIKFHDILASPKFSELSFELLYALLSSPLLQGPEWEIIHVADNRQKIMKKSLEVPDLGPIVQVFLMDAVYAKFMDDLASPQNRNQPLSSPIYTVSGAENAVTPTPLGGTLGLAPSPLGSYIIPPFDSVSSAATTKSISNEISVSVNKNWRPAQQLPIGSGEMIPLQSSTAPSILPPKSSRDSICTVITAHNDRDGTAGAIGGGAIGGGAIGGGATGGGRGEQEGSGAIKSSPTLESAEIRTSSSQESESSSKRRPKIEQIPLRTEPPESRKELRKRQAREKNDTK
ncbi:hypothetical protein QQG55_54185 [Brugia pahangi]